MKKKYFMISIIVVLVIIAILSVVLIANNKAEDNRETKLTKKDEIKIDIKEVYTGRNHIIIEDKDGNIWACGDNRYGQLGIGNNQTQEYFVKIAQTDTGKELRNPNKVIAGKYFTIIEDSDGEIWCCGENAHYSLGLEKNFYCLNKFSKIGKTIDGKEITNPIDIKCGDSFVIIEDSEGVMWLSGSVKYADLTYSVKDNESLKKMGLKYEPHTTFERIGTTETNENIVNPKKIETGNHAIFVEDKNGQLWEYGGEDRKKYFGEGNYKKDIFALAEIVGKNPKQISAGFNYVIIEKANGQLIGAGQNTYGNLTSESYESRIRTEFDIESDKQITNPMKIMCKGSSTVIVDEEGNIWVCGYNYGQFGNTTENYYGEGYGKDKNTKVYKLTLLENLSNKKFDTIKNIYLGGEYLIIKDSDNKYWCSGNNEYGQLGLGTKDEERGIGSFVEFASDRKYLYTNNNSDGEMTYELVDEIPGGYQISSNNAGYKIIEKNGYYYLYITSGTHSSTGYSIGVKNVEIKNKTISIELGYKSPKAGELVGMAFTYPSVILRLNMKPDNVIIDGEIWEQLD